MYDRSKTVGASDAVQIQLGQWAKLFDQKQILPINEQHPPEPPEYALAAEIGHRLEPYNLELFERETGRQVHVDDNWGSDPFTMADNSWCTYLPDGLLQQEKGQAITIFADEFFIPIEVKCINMMWKPANLLTKYMPQLQHAMRVMQSPYCIFSVIYLNIKYEWINVNYDSPYDDALFEKEKLFQWFLETGTRPPEYLGKRKGWR